MNKLSLLAVIGFLVFPILAHAELVILKNGSAVEGLITEKDSQKMKMDVKGVSMTYYWDEIEVIDGVVPTVPAPAPAFVPEPEMVPAVPVVQAKVSELSKKDLILDFIDVFGTRTSLDQNFDQLIKSVPPAQAQEFQKSIKVDDLIEGLVPIYDKYFTAEELQIYIDFYSSPAGRKLVETIPRVMTDSVGVSLKYFKDKIPNASVEKAK